MRHHRFTISDGIVVAYLSDETINKLMRKKDIGENWDCTVKKREYLRRFYTSRNKDDCLKCER